jgi:hypothetical protein
LDAEIILNDTDYDTGALRPYPKNQAFEGTDLEEARLLTVRSQFIAVMIDFGRSRTTKNEQPASVDRPFSTTFDLETSLIPYVLEHMQRYGDDRLDFLENEKGTPANIVRLLFKKFPAEMHAIMFEPRRDDLVLPNDEVRLEALSICEMQLKK